MDTHDSNEPGVVIAVTVTLAAWIWAMRGLLDGFASWFAACSGDLLRYFGYR